MGVRLVLGCGAVGRSIVERLIDGDRDAFAVVESGEDEEWLADRGVPVAVGDPSDEAVLAGVDSSVESVLVAGTRPDRNLAAARAARNVFQDVPIVALGDPGADRALIDRLSQVADDVLEPPSLVGGRVLEHVAGEDGLRAGALRTALTAVDGRLAVVAHDSPDPDAIASAVALAELARALGVDAVPCYFGSINHQENRALVNLLELDLRNLEDPAEIEEFDGVALVDHARPGVNDQLPPETPIDVVIDHHPPNGPVEGRFVDLRSDVGATSTLLTEYFDRLGVALPTDVATALLYGIRIDTDDFTRQAIPADFEAAARLVDDVEWSVLERVESPSVSSETLRTVARAIQRRQSRGAILTSGVGHLGDRDAIAQAAERLLDMEGVDTTLVFGIDEGTVYVSGRSRDADLDLGETMRRAFDQIGSAGGHAEMAGAQIPLGMLIEEGEEDVGGIVEEVVTEAFYDAIYRPIASGNEFAPDVVDPAIGSPASGGSTVADRGGRDEDLEE